MSEERIVRKVELVQLTGLSMTQIDRLKERGKFPQSFALGDAPNSPVGWLYSEVLNWIKQLPPKQHGSSPFRR